MTSPPLPRIRPHPTSRPPRRRISVWAVINASIGMLLGVGLALGIAWGIAPPPAKDVALHTLRPDYQTDFLLLLAQNYQVQQNWPDTQAQLDLLRLSDPAQTVVQVTEALITAQAPQSQIRAMVTLARQLGRLSPAMEPYLP